MKPESFDQMERYLDGTASADDVAALDQMLDEDAAARRDFLHLALLHGQLSQLVTHAPAVDFEEVFGELQRIPRRRAGRFGRPAAAWLVATVATAVAVSIGGLVLAGWSGWLGTRGSAEPRASTAGETPAPRASASAAIGVVKQACLLVTSAPATPLREGARITAGRLVVESGAVEIELENGVVVIVQGKGEIEFIDTMKGFLHAGSALVRVPKGMSGYRLDTPAAGVIDLGTEFAVRAGPGLVTDVQVYDGAVVTTGRSSSADGGFPRRLEAGEARRFRPEAAIDGEPIPYSESRFARRLPSEPGIEHWAWPGADEDTRRFGRPQIDAIVVSRAHRRPVIDGRLDDWPVTHGFRATLRGSPHDPEWVEGRMAYDERCLYIAARVGDPAPMRNQIDPAFDPGFAWQGGGVQVRVSTDRQMGWPADANGATYYRTRGLETTAAERQKARNPRLSHLMMWHHAASGRACLTIFHGMDESTLITNPESFEGRFRMGPDGREYTLEYAIPWELLNAAAAPPQSGDVLAAHWQVHWSDASGRIWRDQLVEIRNPHEIRRLLSFERAATWGRAEFE